MKISIIIRTDGKKIYLELKDDWFLIDSDYQHFRDAFLEDFYDLEQAGKYYSQLKN